MDRTIKLALDVLKQQSCSDLKMDFKNTLTCNNTCALCQVSGIDSKKCIDEPHTTKRISSVDHAKLVLKKLLFS